MKNLLLGISVLALGAVSMPIEAAAKDLGDSWWSKERFQLRLRAIGVFPDDGEGSVDVNGARSSTLRTDVDDAFVPEFDITYFITENVALELIAATAEHDVELQDGTNVGDTMILPPTLTLQYHFTPDNMFSPYIGAGVNYSYFYGDEDAAGFNNLDVEGGFGLALQAGTDIWLNEHWGLNFDVKKIFLDIDGDVNLGAAAVSTDIELDPWIVGAGVSYRF